MSNKPLDFSILHHVKSLRLGKYETTTPAYLEDYDHRLIAAHFAQEFCIAECHRLSRWYDIVRLARQTRLSYKNYLIRCAAEGLPIPPEPDTIAMLKLAPQLDPDGTPEAKDAIILALVELLEECQERLQEEDEEDPADIQLEPGEVSGAFLTEDMLSNQMGKIVKLVEVIPAHTASLNEDYLRLEEMALHDKQERAFREWLSKKIDGMYVYIDPEFRDGEFENKHWVK